MTLNSKYGFMHIKSRLQIHKKIKKYFEITNRVTQTLLDDSELHFISKKNHNFYAVFISFYIVKLMNNYMII